MKFILTAEIPNETLKKEGLDPIDLQAQFEELQGEIKEGCPEGVTITLTIEE